MLSLNVLFWFAVRLTTAFLLWRLGGRLEHDLPGASASARFLLNLFRNRRHDSLRVARLSARVLGVWVFLGLGLPWSAALSALFVIAGILLSRRRPPRSVIALALGALALFGYAVL